jgi:hypothetical protein
MMWKTRLMMVKSEKSTCSGDGSVPAVSGNSCILHVIMFGITDVGFPCIGQGIGETDKNHVH